VRLSNYKRKHIEEEDEEEEDDSITQFVKMDDA
jgi:hypothetical protein